MGDGGYEFSYPEKGMTITPYGRIYATLYEGSLYGKSALHFAVMGYVISKQVPESRDPEARTFVDLNPLALARLFSDSEENVQAVIDELCGEDKKSRTKDEGGRRLVKDGQFRYRVVNGTHYRNLADQERRREINRKAQAKRRALLKAKGLPLAGEHEYMDAWARGAPDFELAEIEERWGKDSLEARKAKKGKDPK
jgi:hypothetical protein